MCGSLLVKSSFSVFHGGGNCPLWWVYHEVQLEGEKCKYINNNLGKILIKQITCAAQRIERMIKYNSEI